MTAREQLINRLREQNPRPEQQDALYDAISFVERLGEIEWMQGLAVGFSMFDEIRIPVPMGTIEIRVRVRSAGSKEGHYAQFYLLLVWNMESYESGKAYNWQCETTDREVALFALARAPR
jgi:hypothetical protein